VRDLHGVKDGDLVQCCFVKVEGGNKPPVDAQPQPNAEAPA